MATAPVYATGVRKTVAIALESTFGVQSTAQAQFLRRITSDINLNVSLISSQEILPSQQVRDSRQGPRQVQGTISGQLSAASYSMLFEGLLRGTFTTGVHTAVLSDTVTTVDSSTGNYIITQTGGDASFLTVGFKRGDICAMSGLTGAAASANGGDMRCINVTATVLTFAPPAATPTWTSGGQTALTISVVGKKLFTPVTGQSDQSFTIEHWYNDIGYSELFLGCKITQITFSVPASGFSTFQAQIIGQQMITGNTQIYPSATAPTTTIGLTCVGGHVVYQGIPQLAVTAFNLQIVADAQADPVIGSDLTPNVFIGTLRAQGSFSALMNNNSMTADFLNEVELEMSVQMTDTAAANPNFISIYLPRMKISSGTRQDNDKAIVNNFNFVGLEQVNGGSGTYWDDTTVTLQDSLTIT